MSVATRRGVAVLCAIAVLGVFGDVALWTSPWGLGVPVWTGALVLLYVAIQAEFGGPPTRGALWLLAPALLLTTPFAWRDSGTLHFINTVAALGCLGLVPLRSKAARFWTANLLDYGAALGGALYRSFAVPALPWQLGIRWGEVRFARSGGWVPSAARGALYGIALIWLFGPLLASADKVFAAQIGNVFNWGFGDVIGVVVCTGAAGALLWHMVAGAPRMADVAVTPLTGEAAPAPVHEEPFRLGIIETVVGLTTVNLLLLAFMAVQFRYLFGGASVVEVTPNLTYAEYARNGFFELVAVAFLALVTLLVADPLLERRTTRDEWAFRLTAGLLIALVAGILASALRRMGLYIEQYGLTELRLYTIAFMGWLAWVFAWFVATVLRRHREWFAVGALAGGLALVAALNLLNPDALITSTNLARERIHTGYLAALSGDAVPTLLAALPALSDDDRNHLAWCLLDRWGDPPKTTWRNWNAARDTARAAVAHDRDQLAEWRTATRCYGLPPER